MIWRDAPRRHARQLLGDGGGKEVTEKVKKSRVRKARMGRRWRGSAAHYDMDPTTLPRRIRFLKMVERKFSTW